MGLIPQNTIDQILQETDIIDIVSTYVPLKKTGANFKACCPFHNEKTPSFVVSPQKQIYHCFGCNAGGNVLGFIMDYEKIDFREAIKTLATRLNISIKLDSNNNEKENHGDQLIKINAYAHWFFKSELQKNKDVLTYIKNRNLSNETVKKFELGYAPDSFESLTFFLKNKKIPEGLATKVGLIKKN